MEDERPEPEDPEEDTEGQALTWMVRKPIPEAEDDTEGQAMRPPPDVENEGLPRLEEEDEVEGNGGGTRSPRPPVD